MQIPIRIRDALWIDHRFLREPVPLGAGDIDDAVDDSVRDVDALGPVLAGKGLGHGAEGVLHGGEGGEEGGAFDGGGGAGED